MPGGPRSPRSPLGPAVPLQREQMQKNGIWSIGGGTGAFSSKSQIAVSGTGGIIGSMVPNTRVRSYWLGSLPLGGHGAPVGGTGPLREVPGQGCVLLDELEEPPRSNHWWVLGSDVEPSSSSPLVLLSSSMAEHRLDRMRSPNSLNNIWRKQVK